MLEHVAVVVPVFNGEIWLDECLQSISTQTVLKSESVKVSVSAYNDASTDSSPSKLVQWKQVLSDLSIEVFINSEVNDLPRGVGYARNRAVEAVIEHVDYLCFLDCDDVMRSDRIQRQLDVCRENKDAIVGSQFTRNDNATVRFTDWCNNLPREKLNVQVFTSHGPTVAMPTWFIHKSRFVAFSEAGPGTPEDLLFFYEHLSNGGTIVRVDMPLVFYRYHPSNTTFAIKSDTIWNIKLRRFSSDVLSKIPEFSIWGAGKLGKLFFRSLSQNVRHRVKQFFDVDASKIAHGFVNLPYLEDEKSRWVPVKPVSALEPPFVICLKLDLLGFEKILDSHRFEEGIDYWIFN